MNNSDKELRVLIVEDSKIDTALVLDELKQGGYNPIHTRVETSEEMSTALNEQPWDVIVSDYTMPRFSALSALKILQDSGRDIPFIIISGSIGEDIAVEALKRGASDYLMKDNMTRFIAAVEREIREVNERKSRRKIEESLKETENSYRRLVEGVKDYGIFLLDLHGNVISWNKGAEHIFGYTTEDIIGKHFGCFYTEEDIQRGAPQNELRLALEHDRHEAESMRVRKDGSEFCAKGVINTVRDESGVLTGFSVVTQDITERKQAEEKIKRLAVELEQKVKERTAQLESVNKELESFSYSVSHDLRAPLRNLISLCSIVLKRYRDKLDEEGAQYLEYILESSQRMSKLINDLLNLSRVSQTVLHSKTMDLSELVKDIARELQVMEPHRQVEFQIKEGIIANGDPALLKIAVQNLMDNAWKFTSTRPVAVIEFGLAQVNGKTAYYIRDNGVGFDPDYMNKLFTPFQRLHRDDEFPGTGVGLATVKRIIHRHGGQVWAEGEINQGATFYFTL